MFFNQLKSHKISGTTQTSTGWIVFKYRNVARFTHDTTARKFNTVQVLRIPHTWSVLWFVTYLIVLLIVWVLSLLEISESPAATGVSRGDRGLPRRPGSPEATGVSQGDRGLPKDRESRLLLSRRLDVRATSLVWSPSSDCVTLCRRSGRPMVYIRALRALHSGVENV